MDIYHSPNQRRRAGTGKPWLLIFHYTALPSYEEALSRLCDEEACVSSHYLVDRDGHVTSLVAEDACAYHAGESCWHGERAINDVSIGIELVNMGYRDGYPSYPSRQIEALCRLSQGIMKRWRIMPCHCVGHSDVAPMRKDDPGHRFPWRFLAERGIGVVPSQREERHAREGRGIPLDMAQRQRTENVLRHVGYAVDLYDMSSVVTAFQRHFRAQCVDGLLDRECAMLAESLASTSLPPP